MRVVCFVFLALSCAPAIFAYRLPTNIIPHQYNLEIVTNLGDEHDKFEFCGNVKIQANVLEPTKNITLHAKNLDINVKSIAINEDKGLVASTHVDEENDFFTIVLNKELEKDKPLQIYIPFKAKLEDVLSGYYRSSYKDKNSTVKYIATTQFESNDARRAFPCFDEPGMKAKFLISMGHTKKYTALSNMNEIKKEPMKDKEGWVWTRFAESVPMSTYLVAFIISDFEHEVADKSHSNVTFRIWARKEAINQVQLAKDVGPKVLTYFENFFGIPYPLPKQDMIAIPDFYNGAMENWGLITYRETALLYDPELSATFNQQYISNTIAHELAHQWFGNLVTMKWWTDLWLNEGFATYMSSLAIDHLHPEWNYLIEETVNNLVTVFDFDSLKSSHQISVEVGHPRDIAEIFDTISYKKGSYILRMMTLFLGEKTLRQGVNNYLLKHRFQNAEQDDLWASLTEQAHANKVLPDELTVKTIMDTWTLQTGYPVISVNRDYENGKMAISQRRFIRDFTLTKSLQDRWWVPLTYTDSKEMQFNDTKPKHYLPNDEKKLEVDGPKGTDTFVLFNIQIGGLYRVNYDLKNWNLLIEYLNTDKFEGIPTVNRIQLIEDSAALAWTGDLKYDVLLDLLKYLHRENDYLPWKSAIGTLHDLHDQLKRTSKYGSFKEYLKKLLTPAYQKFGRLTAPYTDEKSTDGVQKIKLQSMIASSACKAKIDACIKDAKTLFKKFMEDPKKNALSKNLRTVISCNAIRYGGTEEWDFMWKLYGESDVATVRGNIMKALSCTNEPWLLRRYLEWGLDPQKGIRNQDYTIVFSSVAHNPIGWYVAKEFLEEKIEDLYQLFYPNGKRLAKCIGPLTNQMITQSEYEWFDNFTKVNEAYFKDAKQGVSRGLETIKLNVQWQKTHIDDISIIVAKHT